MVRLLATKNYSSRSDLAVDIAAYNLDKKLKEFEFERKQVLIILRLHLNITTLKRAIELTNRKVM